MSETESGEPAIETLSGKTIFVTGASRGVGLAIALRAAQDGANVVIAARSIVSPNADEPNADESSPPSLGIMPIELIPLVLKLSLSSSAGTSRTSERSSGYCSTTAC